MNIWIGRSFGNTGILILGESTYGEDDDLTAYIEKWINRMLPERDHTFSRIFKACTGLGTGTASVTDRKKFWDNVAYCNFVPGTVGLTNKDKATGRHFKDAAFELRDVIRQLKPKGVWILGKGQAEYSKPVLVGLGIANQVAPHPTGYGVPTEKLKESWNHLLAKLP